MEERKSQDIEFVEYIIKSIVDHPEDVEVDRNVDEMGVLITLKVNPADMGQVIGRSGATAKSVRTLLRVIGAQNNARVNLKIIEPEGTERDKGSSPDSEKEPKDSKESKESTLDEAIDELNV